MKKTNVKNIVTLESFSKKYGVRFTEKHTGKMENMLSLSTAVSANKFCQARQKKAGCICKKCYAQAMTKRYNALNKKLIKNYEILTTILIPVEEWPLLNVQICRIESFGDVANVIQAKNYINLVKKNPRVRFAAWSKNIAIWSKAFDEIGKPENLVFIQSSEKINVPAKRANDYVDYVFTVYSEDGESINCGARHCFTCQHCYTIPEDGENRNINELLK